VESAWFFKRGEQSVRIVRVSHRNRKTSLRVDGPGESRVVHRFDDQVTCTLHQSELERRLVGRDFYLERATGNAARGGAPARPVTGLRLFLDAKGEHPLNDLPPAA
jgi:hypothetical protein